MNNFAVSVSAEAEINIPSPASNIILSVVDVASTLALEADTVKNVF